MFFRQKQSISPLPKKTTDFIKGKKHKKYIYVSENTPHPVILVYFPIFVCFQKSKKTAGLKQEWLFFIKFSIKMQEFNRFLSKAYALGLRMLDCVAPCIRNFWKTLPQLLRQYRAPGAALRYLSARRTIWNGSISFRRTSLLYQTFLPFLQTVLPNLRPQKDF